MRGRDRTLTWAGCLCSLVLTASILYICIFYLQTYTRKNTVVVNSYESKVGENQMFNLGQGKQILILEEWNDNLSGIPASKYLRVEFYHITRNTKRGMLQKRRLASVPCSRIPFLKDAGNIDFLIECVEFDSETELGLETTSGNTNYVQADVLPCEQDCEIYVSDVGYEEVISEFLRYF